MKRPRNWGPRKRVANTHGAWLNPEGRGKYAAPSQGRAHAGWSGLAPPGRSILACPVPLERPAQAQDWPQRTTGGPPIARVRPSQFKFPHRPKSSRSGRERAPLLGAHRGAIPSPSTAGDAHMNRGPAVWDLGPKKPSRSISAIVPGSKLQNPAPGPPGQSNECYGRLHGGKGSLPRPQTPNLGLRYSRFRSAK